MDSISWLDESSALKDQWDAYTEAMGQVQISQLGCMAAGTRLEGALRSHSLHRVGRHMRDWLRVRAEMHEAREAEDTAHHALSLALLEVWNHERLDEIMTEEREVLARAVADMGPPS